MYRRTGRPLPFVPGAAAAAALAALLLAPLPAEAQYFGRNKVTWEEHDFQVIETEHFRIYYYPRGNPSIDDVARRAERWYARLSGLLDHRFTDKKPLVLYNTHPDFQQTNITGGLIGEGTGGFTESLQDRIVMPLTGVLSETDHVLGHELVHAFQFDVFSANDRGPNATAPQRLPLWMIEGLAEYLSQGREDPQTALWLRDALLHDRLPDLRDLGRGRYSPYQYGQAFWAYVGGRWGDEAAVRLFFGSSVLGIEEAIRQITGLEPDRLFEEWHAAVGTAYGPILDERRPAAEQARPLLDADRVGSRLNVAPALSPDGRRVAFLSNRSLFTTDLYLADAESGEVLRKLVSSATDPHFDALRFVDSAGAWSPDGRRFAFVVFQRGDNRISIVDADSGRIERRIEVPGVGAISSPAWSPDGESLAFSGMAEDSGVSDLYRLDLDSGRAERLTDDPWGDLQPAWSPDGRTLAFVTERPPGTGPGSLDEHPVRIALLDVGTGSVRVLDGFAGSKHIDPQFSPDGRTLYFLAEPDGVPDVFRMGVEGGGIERVTRVQTGVSGITDLSPALSVAADSGRIAFSVLENDEWNVYALDADEADRLAVPAAPPAAATPSRRVAALLPPAPADDPGPITDYLARDVEVAQAALPEAAPTDYDPDLRLAYIGPPTVGLGVDRYGTSAGGSLSAYFTDTLGDRQLGVSIEGGTAEDFGSLFGAAATYLDRSDRVVWGLSGAHVPYVSARTGVRRQPVEIGGQTVIADVVTQLREEVTIDEVQAIAQYPFSRYRRLEANVGYVHYSFDNEVEQVVVVGDTIVDRDVQDLDSAPSLGLTEVGLAYVGDRSFFGFVSPVRGYRYRFGVESTFGDLEYQVGTADYRRYFFFRPWTIAVRGLHYGRYGSDAEDPRLAPLYVGRPTLVRGYDVGDIDVAECTPVAGSNGCPEFDRLVGSRIGVASLELRVPLLGTEEFGLARSSLLPVELALFVDAGAAWSEGESVDLRFEEETIERVPVVSAGIALRTAIGGFLPVQVYYASPFQRPAESGTFGVVIAPGW